MKCHTRAQVGEKVGVKPARLSRWQERGFINPTVNFRHQGKANMWSDEDVVDVMCFCRLLKAGFSCRLAALILKKG